jgi:hypothetical protein
VVVLVWASCRSQRRAAWTAQAGGSAPCLQLLEGRWVAEAAVRVAAQRGQVARPNHAVAERVVAAGRH